MAGILPAGLQGYVAAEQQARERSDSNLRGMLGILKAQSEARQAEWDAQMNPLKMQVLQKKLAPTDPNSLIAHLDPGKFTPESWADYINSKGDTTKLRATASPTAELNATVNRERILQRQREWASLSPAQQQKFIQDAARLGLDATKLWYETGQSVPVPAAPGAVGPGAGPPVGAQVPAAPGAPGGLPPVLGSSSPMMPSPFRGTAPSDDAALAQFGYQRGPGGLVPIAGKPQLNVSPEDGGVGQEVTAPPGPSIAPAGAPIFPGVGATTPIPRAPAAAPAPGNPIFPAVPPKAQNELTLGRPQAVSTLRTINAGLDRMDQSLKNLEDSPGLLRITGSIFGRLPSVSQSGANAQADLDTLKSQIGVEVLGAMREASKTGGAVGNVTEKEWPILQNQLENLFQTQDTETFKKSLTRLRQNIARIRDIANAKYKETYGEMPDELPAERPAPEAPKKARSWRDL